jgi:nucleoside-diphosphate-sugar epimerase
MRIFVAGGSGAIGVPLVRALVAAGHQVTALTRSSQKESMLRALGAIPALADALDARSLRMAVAAATPTHVIHQLTALPPGGPRNARDMRATNRLRIDGTRNLLDAAIEAGARRMIVGSFAPIVAARHELGPGAQEGADAVVSMETQVLDASRSGRIEGIVLRYGLFYGSGNPATEQFITMIRRRILPVVRGDRSLLPWINLDDAVAATIAALDRGTPGSTYDVVDDHPLSMTELVRVVREYTGAPAPFTVPAWLPRLFAPYLAAVMAARVPLSNEKARAELGWRPAYPSWREGLSRILERAA